jgi:hypothetical protein
MLSVIQASSSIISDLDHSLSLKIYFDTNFQQNEIEPRVGFLAVCFFAFVTVSVLRIQIRDPVPFLPLDPGSGMGKKSGS